MSDLEQGEDAPRPRTEDRAMASGGPPPLASLNEGISPARRRVWLRDWPPRVRKWLWRRSSTRREALVKELLTVGFLGGVTFGLSWGVAGPPSVAFQAQLDFADLELAPGPEWPDPAEAFISQVTAFEATGTRIDLTPCHLRFRDGAGELNEPHCQIVGDAASIRVGHPTGPSGMFRRITPVRGSDPDCGGRLRIEAASDSRISFALHATKRLGCSESVADLCPKGLPGATVEVRIVGVNLTVSTKRLASSDGVLECGAGGASVMIGGLEDGSGATLSLAQTNREAEAWPLWLDPPKRALSGRLASDGRITAAGTEIKAYRGQIASSDDATVSSISWGGRDRRLDVFIGKASSFSAGGRPVTDRGFWTFFLAAYSVLYSAFKILSALK